MLLTCLQQPLERFCRTVLGLPHRPEHRHASKARLSSTRHPIGRDATERNDGHGAAAQRCSQPSLVKAGGLITCERVCIEGEKEWDAWSTLHLFC